MTYFQRSRLTPAPDADFVTCELSGHLYRNNRILLLMYDAIVRALAL